MIGDRRLGLLLVLAVAACKPAAAPVPSNAEPPAVVDLLPGDLDFVIRIDAVRLRNHPLMSALAKGGDVHLHDTMLAGNGSGVLRLVLPELQRARLILVGGRLGKEGYRGDGVVVLEHEPGVDTSTTPPSFPSTLSRVKTTRKGVELYERSSPSRDEAALCVVVKGRGMVLATAAEVDAVLRVLREGPDVGRLDPPPRGLVSFAGRWRSGDEPAAPAGVTSLREVSAGLLRYAGSLEADDAFRVEAELIYPSEKHAQRAAEAARRLLDRVALLGPHLSSLADSAKLAPIGASLGLRLGVPFALIAGAR